jgi:NAD(P)-dependent dehydrogenase (short-subunit alcohol dehydrogenase family)
MTSQTTGPVALITGGTSGIGLATAKVLHANGYAVVVTGRNPQTLAAAREALPDDVVVLRADSAVLADADTVAEEIRNRFGRLDVVYLNAAIALPSPFKDLTEEHFDRHLDINVKGQYFTLRRVLPLLTEGASVIFCSSGIEQRALPGMSAYTATKGALTALARSLAIELAPRGIRVNAVSPGAIDTPAFTKQGLPPAALDGMRADLIRRIPLGRIGRDDEIAHTVAFLASPKSSYISGANIVVDGAMIVSANAG